MDRAKMLDQGEGGARKWFRVEEQRSSCVGFDGGGSEYYYTTLEVRVREFEVVRETPKGVWLAPGWGGRPRFVLRDSRKRYACPTVEEAHESFLARKRRHLRILRAQVESVEEAIRHAAMLPHAVAALPTSGE